MPTGFRHCGGGIRRVQLASCLLMVLLMVIGAPVVGVCQEVDALSQQELEQRVVELFQTSCARSGCHAGSDPQMGMALTKEQFYGHTVDEPSRERPELKLIDPGKPDSSYLIQKVKGAEGIVGAQMPMTGERLSAREVQLLEAWTRGLSDVNMERKQAAAPKTAHSFDGWKVINTPTARMVDKGQILSLISHRFVPTINSGYDTFFGLDGSGIIFLSLGYAPTDNSLITLGRSNADNDVELDVKYRVFQQQLEGGWPLDLALQGSVNWLTEASQGASIYRSEQLRYAGQLILTHEVTQGIGVSVVPGVLFNPVAEQSGESPHLTIGLGGRWRFYRNLSLIGEWVLIPSGFNRNRIFGNENRFDSWGTGLEIAVGGHVFQIVVTNSLGLATDQYLRGGDLDIQNGHLRLGFSIFRTLNF